MHESQYILVASSVKGLGSSLAYLGYIQQIHADFRLEGPR